ncbi:MAG: hypothetical protein BWY76_02714 [bacterium ADurb.Bin429]|nr:MAG: hypothetical protein BWY76_02714 [bacterium ADurb.Bin429]
MRACLHEVLAIIKDEQQAVGPQEGEELRHGFPVPLQADAQREGNCLRHQRALGYRRQIHEPGAVGKRSGIFVRHLNRQPGFSSAADAGKGEKLCMREQRGQIATFTIAPDECRRRRGQVTGRGRRYAERGKETGQSGRIGLVNMLHAGNIAQLMLTEVIK